MHRVIITFQEAPHRQRTMTARLIGEFPCCLPEVIEAMSTQVRVAAQSRGPEAVIIDLSQITMGGSALIRALLELSDYLHAMEMVVELAADRFGLIDVARLMPSPKRRLGMLFAVNANRRNREFFRHAESEDAM